MDKFTSSRTGKTIYLLGNGTPVNFLDGAVFGPALTLVQAELIVAVAGVVDLTADGDLTEIGVDERKKIAGGWQAEFIDPNTGSFPY